MESQFTKKGNSQLASGFKYEIPEHFFHASVSKLKNEAALVDAEIEQKNDFRLERIRVCLEVLRTDKSKRRRIHAIRKSVHAIFFVLYLIALYFGKKWNLPHYSCEVLFVINMMLYFFPESPTSEKWTRALRELLQFDDPSLTGIFVEEQSNTYSGLHIEAIEKLAKLLSKFREGDANQLNQRQRRILLNYLRGSVYFLSTKATFEFPLSILHAISVIGDRGDLWQIDAVARGKFCGKDCPELAEAAQESVARMKSRFLKSKESDSLLRASSPESSPINELLRPAKGGSTIEKAELLRPVE